MIRPLKIGWLMCCFSILMMAVPPQFITSAIADGQCYYCPTPTAYGPLTGPGDGLCGVCGDKTKTRTVYPCAFNNDPDSSCTNTQKQNRSTYKYSCHGPTTTAGELVCYGLIVACAASTIDCVAGCVAVCFTAGVFTGGAACWAAIALCIAEDVLCTCLVEECWCPCAYDGFERGYGNGCT